MKKGFHNAYKCHLIAIIAISLLVTILYSGTLDAPFVFDDIPNIKENPFIRLTDFKLDKLSDVVFKIPASNRPVANISFAINYYFGEYDVLGYHVVNILIHIINGILVYLLISTLLTQVSELPTRQTARFNTDLIPVAPLFAALLFVSHPVQTQSVTYVVQRMTSLAVMFSLLSLVLYTQGRLRHTGLKRGAFFTLCFISWVIALGAKEIAAPMPVLIFLYEWYFFQDMEVQWLRRNIKYVIGLALIFGFLGLIYLGDNPVDRVSSGYAARDFTMSERVLTQFRVVVFYMSLLLFPHPSRLNLIHHIPISQSLLEPITTLFSFFVILGMALFAVYVRRRHRLISFGILWFLITLALESSILSLDIIFEHRLYLPSVGFSILASCLFSSVLPKGRRATIIISMGIILFLCAGTYVRNKIWTTPLTLWTDVLSKNPSSFKAHTNLGKVLARKGFIDEAIEQYRAGLSINANYIVAHHNLGLALVKKGLVDEAIRHYRAALRIESGYADAHTSLG